MYWMAAQDSQTIPRAAILLSMGIFTVHYHPATLRITGVWRGKPWPSRRTGDAKATSV